MVPKDRRGEDWRGGITFPVIYGGLIRMKVPYFTKGEIELLQNYVYAYYDPDVYEETKGKCLPFYIGKGIENRAFDHLYECLKERGKIESFPSALLN